MSKRKFIRLKETDGSIALIDIAEILTVRKDTDDNYITVETTNSEFQVLFSIDSLYEILDPQSFNTWKSTLDYALTSEPVPKVKTKRGK